MAMDAYIIRHGFLPELSKTPGSTPSEPSPCHQWTLPRRDTPLALSAAREPQEDGTKILEPTHGELTVSEQDDQEPSAHDVEASQHVEPNRTHSFLNHRRAIAKREVSPSRWGKGRRLAVWPICPGNAGGDEGEESGADAAAGGEMKDEPSVVEASEAPCFRGGIRENRDDAITGESRLLNSILNENFALRRQVSEMENFLEDHGLVWVGTGPRPRCEQGRESPTSLDLHSILCNIQVRSSTRRSRARVGGGWCKLKEVQSSRKHVPFTWRSTQMELW